MKPIAKTILTIFIITILINLTSCGTNNSRTDKITAYSNIQKTSSDGAPTAGYNPKLVKHLNIKQEVQSPDGNSPYIINNQIYLPLNSAKDYQETGIASWYGTQFHSKLTSNKEPYDLYSLTAAHKTLPLPTYLKVTNLKNHKTIIVRVNDRGPFIDNRIIDLSYAAANKLGFANKGTAKVKIQAIAPYSMHPIKPDTNIPAHIKPKIKSLEIQFAAFKNHANMQKFVSQIKALLLKHNIKFNPKINYTNNLFIITGRVKTIAQYNTVKNIMNKSNLSVPFIKKINTI